MNLIYCTVITLFFTLLNTQISAQQYAANPFELQSCPKSKPYAEYFECFQKLNSICGFTMSIEEYIIFAFQNRFNAGVCCPMIGSECPASITKPFFHQKQHNSQHTHKPILKVKYVTLRPHISRPLTPNPVPQKLISPTEHLAPINQEDITRTVEMNTLAGDKDFNVLRSHPNFHVLAGSHCGFGLRDRISFGEEVIPGELPWLVMLRYRENDQLVFRCGGALISLRYVLTAAHCIIHQNKTFQLVSVRLGEVNLSSQSDCMDVEQLNKVNGSFVTMVRKCSPSPQDIEIESAIPHPDFRLNSILKGFPDDIGLIRLRQEATFSSFVQPICVMGFANPDVRNVERVQLENFEIAGWGMTDMADDPHSNVLRKVNVSMVMPLTCNKLLKRDVNQCQLCAGGIMQGNSCRGDSGGPLMAQVMGRGNEMCPLLVGVVSYGSLDCGYSLPSVFCDASCYLQWILDNVNP